MKNSFVGYPDPCASIQVTPVNRGTYCFWSVSAAVSANTFQLSGKIPEVHFFKPHMVYLRALDNFRVPFSVTLDQDQATEVGQILLCPHDKVRTAHPIATKHVTLECKCTVSVIWHNGLTAHSDDKLKYLTRGQKRQETIGFKHFVCPKEGYTIICYSKPYFVLVYMNTGQKWFMLFNAPHTTLAIGCCYFLFFNLSIPLNWYLNIALTNVAWTSLIMQRSYPKEW